MRVRLENRLARLEQREPPSWKAFLGRPAVEWPDDALRVLCDDEGTFDWASLTETELKLLNATFEDVDYGPTE